VECRIELSPSAVCFAKAAVHTSLVRQFGIRYPKIFCLNTPIGFALAIQSSRKWSNSVFVTVKYSMIFFVNYT